MQKGEAGKPGPLFYPAGIWSQQSEYTRTADLCPFVLYDTGEAETSLYYFLTQEGTFHYDKDQVNKGIYGTPPESMAANGAWKQLDNAGYVFTKFLMADYALLAGAVAYKGKLFSQSGKTKNGSSSDKFQEYGSGNFIPNVEIDWEKGTLACKHADIEGKVKATQGEFTGKVTATSGKFGGFKISGNGFTNENDSGNYNNDAYVIFRNDSHNCFAGIGGNILPASGGYRGVARFENHDSSNWFGMGLINYSAIISARNALTNIALFMDGGCIAGFAEKVQVVEKSCTIDRMSTCVLCVNTSEIILDLPTMEHYDDGHVIEIKLMNKGKVKVRPGKGYQIEHKNSQYVTTLKSTYMHVDKGTHCTYSEPYTLNSVGDASKFVYARNINNGTQYGCWVQFKNPR
ncbi:MAG: hypothetical protein LUF04_01615, partial [Bacteroides sp.]|nr:hypothetical protein [Bacteroides sp.]